VTSKNQPPEVLQTKESDSKVFFTVRQVILESLGYAKGLVYELIHFGEMGSEGYSTRSIQTMADILGMNRKRVVTILKALENDGLITRHSHGRRSRINTPEAKKAGTSRKKKGTNNRKPKKSTDPVRGLATDPVRDLLTDPVRGLKINNETNNKTKDKSVVVSPSQKAVDYAIERIGADAGENRIMAYALASDAKGWHLGEDGDSLDPDSEESRRRYVEGEYADFWD